MFPLFSLTSKSNQKKRNHIPPEKIILVSFAAVILVGSVLLMLPFSSREGSFTPFLTCFFTATSATCVTGLVLVDTFSHWSTIGHLILMMLIQIGGLGLLTFTTFLNIALGKKLGLRGLQLASESVNSTSLADARSLISMVVGLSLGIEAIGACLLSTTFVPKYGSYGLFISIFLSVSAFCNAGFDVLGFQGEFGSLTNYTDDPMVQFTVMGLIIVGGLGFIVWNDLLHYRRTKKLLLHSRIVLWATAILLLTGTVLICLLEWNNPDTLGALPVSQRLTAGLFQSVTMRTAGFNTIDLASMREMTKIVSIVLMFIGAAPGSTGGGIKVSTMTVVITTAISTIRGYNVPVIGHRKISPSVVYRSLSIIFLGLIVVVFTTGIITYTSPIDDFTLTGIDAIFEAVSAFATVGVSSGVTAVSSKITQLALCLAMFIGRIGPVSFGLSFVANRSERRSEIWPEGKIIVG